MKTASKRFLAVVTVVSISMAACDVEKTKDGDVTLPNYEVSKTREGNVTVPEYEVTGPDISVEEKRVEVAVPKVSVEKETVSVPDIDIKTGSEKKAEQGR